MYDTYIKLGVAAAAAVTKSFMDRERWSASEPVHCKLHMYIVHRLVRCKHI